MKVLLLLLMLLFVLNSCKNKQTQQQQIQETDSSTVKKDSSFTVHIDGIPAWFEQLPQKDGYIYTKGQGYSLRPNLAREKALLQARMALAKKVNELNNRQDAQADGAGAKEALGNEDTRQIVLEKSMIKQQKQIKRGKHWQVFVLLEMKITKK